MIRFCFRLCIRWLIMAIKFRKSFLAFVMLNYLSRILFFSVSTERDVENVLYEKDVRRKAKKNIGWASHDKKITLKFLGRKLFSIRLKEGIELTAEHFYFSRRPAEIINAFKIISKHIGYKIKIELGANIFEPGCGCARILYYLSDRYGAKCYGVDVYEPAVKVSKSANVFDDVIIEHRDALQITDFEHLTYKPFEMVICSSYLGHIIHMDRAMDYIKSLVRIGKEIVVIDRMIPQLKAILDDMAFLIIERGETLYAYYGNE
jgi:hypothetical protein